MSSVNEINSEIERLEELLASKKKERNDILRDNLAKTASLYSLASFVGQEYIYDRPQKWNSPKTEILEEKSAQNLSYLRFNGIVSGFEINELYNCAEHLYYFAVETEANFASFVIPDEDFEEDESNKGLPIPLGRVWELLLVKV